MLMRVFEGKLTAENEKLPDHWLLSDVVSEEVPE